MTAQPGPGLAGRLALARSTLDRLAEHRTDPDWLDRAWGEPGTRVMLVGDGQTLVDGHALHLVAPGQAPPGPRYLLGAEPGGPVFFAVDVQGKPVPPANCTVVCGGLREVAPVLSDRDAGMLVLAVALANWHASHPRCPRCGEPTEVSDGGFVRRCPGDGSEHYPRTDPAVIVLVSDSSGDRALLGRSARWGEARFSTLAGFVEPGESAEAAVVREVAEESKVAVAQVRYAGSQPWPFPSSLMIGFLATAAVGSPEPVADGIELAEARWFSRADLASAVRAGAVLLPGPVSIARRLIEQWYGDPLPDAGGRW